MALVAADLEPVVDDLCAVLGLSVGYRDPGVGEFGLVNAVLPVGDTFLEVVSPVVDDTTAGRFLARRGGDGGYMVILQSDDLDEDRRRVAALGVRVVWQIDLPDVRGTHLHPRDVGGAILSLDDATPPSSWRWAGPSWEANVRTDVALGLTGVVIQAGDPAGVAARWSSVLDRPVDGGGGGDGGVLTLKDGRIRFVPEADGRGDGVSAIEVLVTDVDEVRRRAAERDLLVDDRVSVGGVELLVSSLA